MNTQIHTCTHTHIHTERMEKNIRTAQICVSQNALNKLLIGTHFLKADLIVTDYKL